MCTLPGLAQTCNAAVATNDPGSCQQGLDDHDIQTNCVSAGPEPSPGRSDAGASSGPDTGTSPPQADSGAASSHDTGAPDTNPGLADTGPTSTCGAASIGFSAATLGP